MSENKSLELFESFANIITTNPEFSMLDSNNQCKIAFDSGIYMLVSVMEQHAKDLNIEPIIEFVSLIKDNYTNGDIFVPIEQEETDNA